MSFPNLSSALRIPGHSIQYGNLIYEERANCASSLDNKAKILNISYGFDEVTQGDSQLAAENTALTQLAAQGITVVATSGDGGAYGQTGTSTYPAQLEVTDPGAQPLVTCVGGTSLSTGPHEVRLGESVWNRLGLLLGASGGGVSSYWPIPSWQAPSYVTTNGGSSTYRNVPDVAAVGDPFTGVAAYSKMNGGWLQEGGSTSATIWAGYISILNAGLEYVTGQKLGFFNPTFYNTTNIVTGPLLYPVIDGTNGNPSLYGTPGYNAGFGYNNCTGTGTIYGGGFGVQILSSGTGGNPPGASRIFDPTLTDTSASFTWTAGKRATGYVVGLFLPQHDFFECFVTKETRFTFKNLLPKATYHLYVYGVSQGGSTFNGFLFTTK
jgi:subtilase family serine protease